MVYYVKQGMLPETRHTYSSRDNLLREELFGEESFEGSYSLLYHMNEPTRIKEFLEIKKKRAEFTESDTHRLLDTRKIKPRGDFITGSVPVLGTNRMTISISKPNRKMDYYYRHGLRDQIIFVQKGKGVLGTMMGNIDYSNGDYIYIPKGTSYSITYSGNPEFLIIDSLDNISIPKRYLNQYGQIKEGVPYYTRDIRPPLFKPGRVRKGEFTVKVDFDDKFIVEKRETHPFDLVGWDGYHYPFAINVKRMMPIVGKVHQPPPVHESFSAKSFMVATFLPRKFDFHERAIPISYYHSNVDTDEFIYYSSGNFMSRKGISEGAITLHVRGLVHGPQPRTVESAIGKDGTDETAVMVESYDRMGISNEGKKIEAKDYMNSWYR